MNLLLITELQAEPASPAFGGEFQAHIASKRNPVVRRASLTAWSLLAKGFALICPGAHGQNAGLEALDTCDGTWVGYEELRRRCCRCTCTAAAGCAMDKPRVTFGEGSSLTGEAVASYTANISATAVGDAFEPYLYQQDCTKLPRRLPNVRFDSHGKPEFADCGVRFSLAHSGNFAVALLSESPCGVDVERVREDVAGRLCARVLSEEEQRLGMDFFECWTKKECIGKLSGLGIDAHPSKLDTQDRRWADRFHCVHLTDVTGEAYVLSALCERDSHLCTLRLPR